MLTVVWLMSFLGQISSCLLLETPSHLALIQVSSLFCLPLVFSLGPLIRSPLMCPNISSLFEYLFAALLIC